MKRATLVLVALALLLGGTGRARAELIITFSQNGADVVANGVGSLNFLGLTFSAFDMNPPSVNASAGLVDLGPVPGTYADYYGNISGPTSFGPGGNFLATSGTSTAANNTGAGVDGATGQLLVPGGYFAGTAFTINDTWAGTTISGLGLTPGTYTWTWGSGSNADDLKVIIPGGAVPVPEPASLTLLAICAVGLLGHGWRRRKRAVA
ncbi:MAG TPA: PEP-CTERM sorting domain-containing protein [Gemmataceae bacterium]|jgi:hypothetical protein|nr:PEP-CTERM sorting domain-containing protein [Gemmataceae bacterium]